LTMPADAGQTLGRRWADAGQTPLLCHPWWLRADDRQRPIFAGEL